MHKSINTHPILKRPVFLRGYASSAARIGLALLLTIPAEVLAAESATSIVIVADSRKLTGVRAWWANVYNESHLYFALLTIILIPLAGIILGTVADQLMSRIGIDLKSRVLREH